MKYTLLQLVQEYQDKSNGFPISSIFDSDETQQAATIAESVYYDLETKLREAEFTSELLTVDSVGDTSKPNYLQLPSRLYRVQDSRMSYLVDGVYKDLMYLAPDEFLQLCVDSNDSNVDLVTDYGGALIPVRNNKEPSFFTSFDGQYLVTDSYDSDVETTLQAFKTRVIGSASKVFLIEDDFEIPLPENIQPLYRDMFIVEAYEFIMQEPAPSSVQRKARVGQAKLQQRHQRVGSQGKRINYGRR
jgi:hypothetical protein